VNASKDVVLVHGLWMTGTELFLLRRRLERAGFRVHRFRYSTVGASVAENAARLFEFVKELDVSTLHFVGYSLGGIVTLRMLAEHHHALPAGRVVFLGSPLHGSRAAAHLAKRRWGRRLLGRAIDAGLLDDHGMHWRHAREAAVIAGNRPMGLGLFTGALPEPNDGTVAVAEASIDGLPTAIVPATHVTLLFRQEVAALIASFLSEGKLGQAER